MASKTQLKNYQINRSQYKTNDQKKNYCNDCLYHWCKNRTKVTFCTMKSKGLFECKSCMLIIIGSCEKEFLYTDEKIIEKAEIISVTTN